jgi:hypothetical protein
MQAPSRFTHDVADAGLGGDRDARFSMPPIDGDRVMM